MDSARQIIRWSLPGLVLIVNLFALHALWTFLVYRRPPWSFIDSTTTPAVVAIIAGGLPVGFLLYQLYYHNYRPVGGFRFLTGTVVVPLFFRRDRGGDMLRRFRENHGNFEVIAWVDARIVDRNAFETQTEGVVLKRRFGFFLQPEIHLCSNSSASAAIRCQQCIKAYSSRSENNWTLFQSLLDYCSAADERRWLKSEYTSGSDLYHGLGSARSAVLVSLYVSCGYELVRLTTSLNGVPPSGWFVALAVLLSFGTVFLEYYLLSRCRDELSRNYETRTAVALAFVSRDLHPRPTH